MRNRTLNISLICLIITFVFVTNAYSNVIAVIVNKNNSESLSKAKISKIFRKEYRVWESGRKVIPVNLKDGSDIFDNFTKNVLGRSTRKMKSYWIQKKITKSIKAPKNIKKSSEVKDFVKNTENAIGYIPKGDVDDSVKVVLEVE